MLVILIQSPRIKIISSTFTQGVIVYSMSDLPLGFGVAAKATAECRHADPMNIITFHQADIGEYIRAEETLL